MSDSSTPENSIEDGKNRFLLMCTKCPSKILNPLTGAHVKQDKELPKMTQKKNSPEVECDSVKDWFLVDDMFTFENVGVSNVVNDVKYLTCADCEYGPIGWVDTNNQKYYVASLRVRHFSPASPST